MSGPVLWGISPIADEGLMSLVTRTAAKNILPSSHTLLSQVGLANANNPTAALLPELHEERLATILRLPIAEVIRRRHASRPEPGFINWFGVAVRADEIVFRRRRFGPAAIGTIPYARAIWSLKMVPCCTEYWQYLVETCACSAVQRWQMADRLHRCDVCNGPLADTPTVAVDPLLRRGLSFILGLVDPDEGRRAAAVAQLPSSLSEWDAGMVFELGLAIMPLTESGYRPDRGRKPAESDLVRHATSLAEAADVIRNWPESLHELLEQRVGQRAVSKRNARYTGASHYVSGLTSDLQPAIVREAIEGALASISSPVGSVPIGQIGMREAAVLTGQEERKLAAARRVGLLRTRICLRANRILPTLDRTEIEKLNDFLENRVGPDRGAHRLGLPRYAIGQLADCGLLPVNNHPYILEHFGTHQIHENDLAAFRQRLWDGGAPVETIEDPVLLHRAARAIGGGPKPWGHIFSELLGGNIAYSISRDASARISISACDAIRLRSLELSGTGSSLETRITQRDAVEILNLPLKHANLLVADAPLSGEIRFCADRIQQLARTRITLAEMSARTGIHGTRLEGLLERGGCPRYDNLGWRRSEALAHIAHF